MLFGVLAGLATLQIIFLAEHEQHHVGILLDRAGFAQIRELRAFILALLDLAGELGERKDRHVQLLGERLQPGGDLRDLLNAALCGAPGRARQKLEIIHDDEAEAPLALQPPRAGGKLGNGDAAGLVDIKRQVLELLGDLDDAVEFVGIDAAAADALGRNIGLLGDDAGGELLSRHFEREEADDRAVDRVVALVVATIGLGHVIGDVGGERRLAHRRGARR